jgi:predicted nucleic acid-binding protein
MSMVFVDTWAWLALALRRDQHHASAQRQHTEFLKAKCTYVTTDYVLSESISRLYRDIESGAAEAFVMAILNAAENGIYRLERVTPDRFDAAWQLRCQYADKPDISFVDFTSFVVMKELGIDEVFTGDSHFEKVNLGFRLLPS